MKHIGNLKGPEGSKHKKQRIGRGAGSGYGGTSTKGHKGQQSRAGYKRQRGFEGGQMPLNRRVPKFGFNNRSRIEYQVVNVGKLQDLVDKNKILDNTVNYDILHKLGVISKTRLPLKILGNGALTTALNIEAHNFTSSAKQKIENAGGKVIIYG